MNDHFDTDNPDQVEHKSEYSNFNDNMKEMALVPNTHKFVLNFWSEELQKEFERIQSLNITDHLTKVKYVCNVMPYYYFQLTDPDGNIIEINGDYTPMDGDLM